MNTHKQILVQSEWRTPLAYAFVANFIWINLSEVFRYFTFVMPMMRDALPTIPDVAPMNVLVFMIWGVWDTILVGAATIIPWLALKVLGVSLKNSIIAGTGVWLAIFVILWLGLFNMNLATPKIVVLALALAWVEMVVAAIIVWWFMVREESDAG